VNEVPFTQVVLRADRGKVTMFVFQLVKFKIFNFCLTHISEGENRRDEKDLPQQNCLNFFLQFIPKVLQVSKIS